MIRVFWHENYTAISFTNLVHFMIFSSLSLILLSDLNLSKFSLNYLLIYSVNCSKIICIIIEFNKKIAMLFATVYLINSGGFLFVISYNGYKWISTLRNPRIHRVFQRNSGRQFHCFFRQNIHEIGYIRVVMLPDQITKPRLLRWRFY